MAGVVDNLKNMHWEPKDDLRNTNYVMSCFWCSRHALNKPNIHVLLLKFLLKFESWKHLLLTTEFIIYKFKINLLFCSGVDLRFLCTSQTYIKSSVQLVHILCSCSFMHMVHRPQTGWCRMLHSSLPMQH